MHSPSVCEHTTSRILPSASLQHPLCLVLVFGISSNATQQSNPKPYLLFKMAVVGALLNIQPWGGAFGLLSRSLGLVNASTVEH